MTAFKYDQDDKSKFGKLVRLLVLLKINLLRRTVT